MIGLTGRATVGITLVGLAVLAGCSTATHVSAPSSTASTAASDMVAMTPSVPSGTTAIGTAAPSVDTAPAQGPAAVSGATWLSSASHAVIDSISAHESAYRLWGRPESLDPGEESFADWVRRANQEVADAVATGVFSPAQAAAIKAFNEAGTQLMDAVDKWTPGTDYTQEMKDAVEAAWTQLNTAEDGYRAVTPGAP